MASQEPGTENPLKEVAKAIADAGGKAPIQVQTAAVRADVRADVRPRSQGTRRPRYSRHCARPSLLWTCRKLPTIPTMTACWKTTSKRVGGMPGSGARDARAGRRRHRQPEHGYRRAWRTQRFALLCRQRRGTQPMPCASARMGAQKCSHQHDRVWMDAKRRESRGNSWRLQRKLIKYLPYRRLLKPEEIAGSAALSGLACGRLRHWRGNRDRWRTPLPRVIHV